MNQPPSPSPASPPPPPASPPMDGKRIAAIVALIALLVGAAIALRLLTRRIAPNPREGWRARSADIRARSERLRNLPATDPARGRVYLAQSCPEVADRFGLRSPLSTEEAARVWAEQYQGRWVRWAVSANRVMNSATGVRQVQFKCSDRSFAFDGAAFFRPDQGPALDAIGPNTVIEFEGQLAQQNSLLGVLLSRAELLR